MTTSTPENPWWVFEVSTVENQQIRQRYPQSFLTKEQAEGFIKRAKQLGRYTDDTNLVIEQEAYDKAVPEGDFEKD